MKNILFFISFYTYKIIMGSRLSTLKTFGIALAVSAGIHLGVPVGGYGIHKGINYLRNPPKKQEIMHEDIQKISELDKLRAEKQQYVKELHSALLRGEEIKLSEFFIRSESLDRQIKNAENGESGPSEREYKKEYDKLVMMASIEIGGTSGNELKALYDFVHVEAMKEYYYECDKFEDVPLNGCFNCVSSTELFSALMEDVLGRKDYQVLLFDDHLATYIDGKVIENTSHYWKKSRKKYDGCGLPLHRDIFIAAYLVANGVAPSELPKDLSDVYSSKKRKWKGCPKTGKDESGIGESGFPDPGVLSGLIVPKHRVPNPRYDSKRKKIDGIVKMAEAFLAAERLRKLHDPAEFVEVEMNERKMLINPIPIHEDADWIGFVGVSEYDSTYSDYSIYVPEEKRKCFMAVKTPLDATLETMASMGNMKFPKSTSFTSYDLYRKDYICEQFGQSITNKSLEELGEYTPYATFCPEYNDVLKERYLKEKDARILLILANMKNKNNFELFVQELDSKNKRIKQHAAYGIVNIDEEDGCDILKKHKIEKDVKQYVWLCRDDEELWKEIRSWGKGKRTDEHTFFYFAVLKGENINKDQYEFLKKAFHKVHYYSSKIEITRILYEYGDEQTANEYMKKIVGIVDVEGKIFVEQLCDFPPELMGDFLPMLDEDHISLSLAFALAVVQRGEYTEYMDELVPDLREYLYDNDKPKNLRVLSAYLLLKMGVNPVDPVEE